MVHLICTSLSLGSWYAHYYYFKDGHKFETWSDCFPPPQNVSSTQINALSTRVVPDSVHSFGLMRRISGCCLNFLFYFCCGEAIPLVVQIMLLLLNVYRFSTFLGLFSHYLAESLWRHHWWQICVISSSFYWLLIPCTLLRAAFCTTTLHQSSFSLAGALKCVRALHSKP